MKKVFILICLIIVLLPLILNIFKEYEAFQLPETSAICIISRNPNDEWLSFLNTYTKYNVYMVIDDETINIQEYSEKYPKVNIIQVSAEVCRAAGFKNSSYVTLEKDIIAWDKALYYFSVLNTSHEYVWFIEDDVYFKSEETLLNIDAKYQGIDLLCQNFDTYYEGNTWHWWPQIEINLPQPYHNSLVCACRISKALLSEVKGYCEKNGTMFFIEALFPTLVAHANLSYMTPHEFKNMTVFVDNYIDEHPEAKDDAEYLFHPIKDFSMHSKLRGV